MKLDISHKLSHSCKVLLSINCLWFFIYLILYAINLTRIHRLKQLWDKRVHPLWINSWFASSIRLTSLRSSPCFIRYTPGVGLRPILFLIFINDLPDNIKSSVCLFADDYVQEHSFFARMLFLQEDLDSFVFWKNDWQMKFMLPNATLGVTRHYSHIQILHEYTLHWSATLENVLSAK